MRKDSLLFLESAGPQALLLQRLLRKNPSETLKTFDGICVVFCSFVSSDTHYLHVKIRVPKHSDKSQEAETLIQLPHHCVLALIQADRERMIGFSQSFDA